MEVGDGEAEPCRGLEAAGRSVHSNRRGFERVVVGEYQSTPVLAVVVRSVWRTSKDIMPLENIRLGRMRNDIWGRILRDCLVLLGQALVGSPARHVTLCRSARTVSSKRMSLIEPRERR